MQKTITINVWDAASIEQRSEWLRDGVLVDEAGMEVLKDRQRGLKEDVGEMKRRKF